MKKMFYKKGLTSGPLPFSLFRMSEMINFKFVVGNVESKNVSGLLYGGFAVPFTIAERLSANSETVVFPSITSFLGIHDSHIGFADEDDVDKSI